MSDEKISMELRNISKGFPGVQALKNVSMKIRQGTVHALMGENGAGKSTLMKCAFGIYEADEGEIYIDGEKKKFHSPIEAMHAGISMIHQELHPIRTRNVMENIWVGRIPYKKRFGIEWVDGQAMYEKTAELLKRLNINLDPGKEVRELSSSMCQLIEVARAVSYGARVIIMDEPTSSLTEKEVYSLFELIHKLTQEGTSIIYISHKMDEILQISNDISIMRDGEMIGTWAAKDITQQVIIQKMVGREMKNQFPVPEHTAGDVYLKVDGLTSAEKNSFKDISFEVRKGEIFGIGGLVGAQRTELMESIFGLRPVASGIITIDGNEVSMRSPGDAIRHKMALLTEERRATGIFPMLDIEENIVVAKQNAAPADYTGKGILLKNSRREEDAKKYVASLKIKTPSLKTQIQYLSGGNQQKVLLGRWLLLNPQILILDEPTRGIDVGAKYEIYCLIEQMAREGKSIIMISSEMPELIGMSDRIMVMCEGHNSGILSKEEVTEEKIMQYASFYKRMEEKEK